MLSDTERNARVMTMLNAYLMHLSPDYALSLKERPLEAPFHLKRLFIAAISWGLSYRQHPEFTGTYDPLDVLEIGPHSSQAADTERGGQRTLPKICALPDLSLHTKKLTIIYFYYEYLFLCGGIQHQKLPL